MRNLYPIVYFAAVKARISKMLVDPWIKDYGRLKARIQDITMDLRIKQLKNGCNVKIV